MSDVVEEQYDEDLIDLRALFAKLLSRRWWIFGCVLLSTSAFTIAAFRITPVYRASVLLISSSAERSSLSGSLNSALGQLGGLASLAGINVGSGDAATEEALAVLRSRDFTTGFINDNHLMPILFAKQWSVADGKWRADVANPPTQSTAFKYFNSKIRSVTQDKKTGLITVQIEWTDRIAAANWANELVQRLNTEMRSRALAQADASIGYLQKELASTSILEVREAINRLIETQVKQRMLANVTQQYAFRIVDKATAPDANDPVRPNKRLLLVSGPLAGLLAGVVLVLLFGSTQVQPARE
jgi:Uncharacterized protein involved in exopolysaccharide biosynthesis